MATGSWQVGFNISPSFAGTLLKVRSSRWLERVEKLIVTHSQSGGVQGWLPGILDGEGGVEAVIDSAAVPSGFNITVGTSAFFLYRIGSANPYSCPVTVSEVHFATEVAGLSVYGFAVALNSEVGAYVRA